MTESEAIKILQRDLEIQVKNKALTDGIEAIQIAIQALEKQIPKKPMVVYDDKVDSNWCSCPICANGIGWKIHARKIKFCWECGHRLDFGDDEKHL